jgi:hypothetical protein
MERKNLDLVIKIAIVLCIIGICAVYLLFVNHGEGDPYFDFFEVSVNDTINSSVIHLENKDIMNAGGLDVRQNNGKITRIYFRYSDTTPGISASAFDYEYGSRLNDPSSRKYIEYHGVYYYVIKIIP